MIPWGHNERNEYKKSFKKSSFDCERIVVSFVEAS